MNTIHPVGNTGRVPVDKQPANPPPGNKPDEFVLLKYIPFRYTSSTKLTRLPRSFFSKTHTYILPASERSREVAAAFIDQPVRQKQKPISHPSVVAGVGVAVRHAGPAVVVLLRLDRARDLSGDALEGPVIFRRVDGGGRRRSGGRRRRRPRRLVEAHLSVWIS